VSKKKIRDIIKKKRDYTDNWIFIMLLTTLVILGESLKTYTFNAGSINLTYTIFLVPFMFFIVNYIIKKYGFKEAVMAVIISFVCLLVFVLIMSAVVHRSFNFSDFAGEMIGYLFSQLVNIAVNYFLMYKTKRPFVLVYLTYIFGLVVFYMMYIILSLNSLLVDNFWVSYFATLLIQAAMCLLLTYFDSQEKITFE
jgi:uncharacterized PurR-regulated membrane protein YhhQ (DUF165 family)